MAKKVGFSANAVAQTIYQAVHEAIKDLSNDQAVAVLEEAASNLEAQAEGIREEMED